MGKRECSFTQIQEFTVDQQSSQTTTNSFYYSNCNDMNTVTQIRIITEKPHY